MSGKDPDASWAAATAFFAHPLIFGELALTGAEGLIPDSARHYSVRLEWWLEDGEWQLARLNWE